jgi:hypothetical protein
LPCSSGKRPYFDRQARRKFCSGSSNASARQQKRDALLRPASQEEILQRLEQRAGPEGRRLLENFFAKVKRLEQQNGLSARPALLKNEATRS